MRPSLNRIAAVCVTASLFAVAGCSHSGGSTPAAPPPPAVTSDPHMQQFESMHQQGAAADAQKRAQAAAKMTAHP